MLERAHARARDEDVGGGDDVDEIRIRGAPAGAVRKGFGDAVEVEAGVSDGLFDELGDGVVPVERIQIDGRGACFEGARCRQRDDRRQTPASDVDVVEGVDDFGEAVVEHLFDVERPCARAHHRAHVFAVHVHHAKVARGEQRRMQGIVDDKGAVARPIAKERDVSRHVAQQVLQGARAGVVDLDVVEVADVDAEPTGQDGRRRAERCEEGGAAVVGGDDVDLDTDAGEGASHDVGAHEMAAGIGDRDIEQLVGHRGLNVVAHVGIRGSDALRHFVERAPPR